MSTANIKSMRFYFIVVFVFCVFVGINYIPLWLEMDIALVCKISNGSSQFYDCFYRRLLGLAVLYSAAIFGYLYRDRKKNIR
jgi:hypothetical protein